ncbi:hypothetical protein [Salegentibacter salarius]|uniref:Uncharacterized protein n=1 Tax=Salegentibacter salarius TaxID=435906 RepID=A0A2N0TRK5_9FLAO|nr:hypothetical protein [Salegentibacter salarius]OEY71970.1 hypothetical protein BHS39_14730 [Salegentibacter salarius]PKD17326.1 hypothetical protein APR40_14700 [Salegentibacter salarius]SLK05614.1 hypothetical protein SAMN05660445_03029 [Salegentibacter salarius]
MKKYFIFGKRAVLALEDGDLDGVVEAIDDLEGDVFIFEEGVTQPHDLLAAYSNWTDYAYLSDKEYSEIADRI